MVSHACAPSYVVSIPLQINFELMLDDREKYNLYFRLHWDLLFPVVLHWELIRREGAKKRLGAKYVFMAPMLERWPP
jgi:hypothetical protein